MPNPNYTPQKISTKNLEKVKPGFMLQIEACRREVAQWPQWMKEERQAPAWMEKYWTDL